MQNISEVCEHAETQNLEKCFFLSIAYNMTISWPYPLNSSQFIFSLCDSENHLQVFFMLTWCHVPC